MEKISFIAIICFILSLILLLVLGSINYNFYNNNNLDIITERTLYEQFSYEVYSSIGTPLPAYYKIRTECDDSEEPIQFNLNLDTFFDCRNVHLKDLEPQCRDSIVNNYTSCSSEFTIDFNNLGNIEVLDDRKVCDYFSKYTQKISKLYNNSVCKSKNNYYQYHDLLTFKNDDQTCKNGYKKCGILDTFGNILCFPEVCPINNIYHSIYSYTSYNNIEIDTNNYIIFDNSSYNYNSKVIVSITISENHPSIHEWDKMVKETYEDIEDKEIEIRRSVTKKQFKEVFEKEIDDTFNIIDGLNLKVREINDYNHIKNFDERKYNKDQNLAMYVRNYIGFKNLNELNRFKKIFNDLDETDNPLYKLSSSNHEPLIEIIFSCVFISISVLYLYFKNKLFFQDNVAKIVSYIFETIVFLFLAWGLSMTIWQFIEFPKITIEMDERMKAILDLYNKRTKMCKIFRIINLVFNGISFILLIVNKFRNK